MRQETTCKTRDSSRGEPLARWPHIGLGGLLWITGPKGVIAYARRFAALFALGFADRKVKEREDNIRDHKESRSVICRGCRFPRVNDLCAEGIGSFGPGYAELLPAVDVDATTDHEQRDAYERCCDVDV